MRLASLTSLVAFSLSVVACGGNDPASSVDANPEVDAPPPIGPSSCRDHVQNNDETDVDCGGACGATCPAWANCDWHDDCAGGGICATGPTANHGTEVKTCRPRVDACTPEACGDGLCQTMETDLDPASPTSIVVAYCEQRAALGAVCRTSGDKDVRTCVDGAVCAEDPSDVFTDRCVAATTPAGAACTEDTCIAGYFCDHSSFGSGATCKPEKSLGAACLNSVECATGLACNEVSNTCTPRAPIGGTCFYGEDGRDECQPGEHCELAAGLACENWVECGSQMDCCATATGSECRPFDSHTHCAPPAGACAAGAF